MSILVNRRLVLAATLSTMARTAWCGEDGRPKVTRPRATDGDSRSEPAWDELFTITVGNKGADINGSDDRAIQAAVDGGAERVILCDTNGGVMPHELGHAIRELRKVLHGQQGLDFCKK